MLLFVETYIESLFKKGMNLSIVFSIKVLDPVKFRSCFGIPFRDAGQKRSPRPPAIITPTFLNCLLDILPQQKITFEQIFSTLSPHMTWKQHLGGLSIDLRHSLKLNPGQYSTPSPSGHNLQFSINNANAIPNCILSGYIDVSLCISQIYDLRTFLAQSAKIRHYPYFPCQLGMSNNFHQKLVLRSLSEVGPSQTYPNGTF